MPANSLFSTGRLVSLATSMRAGSGLLDLRQDAILRTSVDLLQHHYPTVTTLFGTVAPFIMLAYAIYARVGSVFKMIALVQKIKAHSQSSITISASHPIRHLVDSWLAENTSTPSKSMSLQRPQLPSLAGNDALQLTSNVGSTSFRFNGRTYYVTKQKSTTKNFTNRLGDSNTVEQPGDLIITTFGRNVAPIREFLQMVQESSAKSKETMFYRIEKNSLMWSRPIGKMPRSMDSIAMQADVKDRLVKDIAAYLSEDSKKWYASVGISHRRGWLLYGPCGTGKSSVVSSLAGHFGLGVYSISLSNPNLTDEILEELFMELPEKSLVLLEDIDSAGIGREGKPGKSGKKQGITLAGLLNVIDGVSSPDHRVLCMTSNSPDSLDPALVRPGRIDMKILFSNANNEVTQHLFKHILADSDSTQDIAKLSEAFAAAIPEDKITPAELQNYLLQHRGSPLAAVEGAKACAETLIKTKSQGRNVAEFAGQIGDESDASADAGCEEDTDEEADEERDGRDAPSQLMLMRRLGITPPPRRMY